MHEFNEDLLWGATNDDLEVELESDSDTDLAIHFIEYMARPTTQKCTLPSRDFRHKLPSKLP